MRDDRLKAQIGISKIEWHCLEGTDETFEGLLKQELRSAGLAEDAIKVIKY